MGTIRVVLTKEEEINERLKRVQEALPRSWYVWVRPDGLWVVQNLTRKCYAPSYVGRDRELNTPTWFKGFYPDVWAAIKEVW